MTKVIDVLKAGFVGQGELAKDHPWVAVGMIWALAILALVF